MAKSNINIDVSELKAALEKISKTSIRAIELVDEAITDSAYDIAFDLNETIQKGSRSGHTYKRRSVEHQASAEGEAPKSDTGRLAESIRPVTSFMSAEVGSLANVAKYGDSFEPKRPWITPINDKYEPLIAKRVNNAIVKSGFAS